MAENKERKDRGYNADLDAQQRGYDSDYDPGRDHFGGRTIAGKDPVALAKKWGGNSGGGRKKKQADSASDDGQESET